MCAGDLRGHHVGRSQLCVAVAGRVVVHAFADQLGVAGVGEVLHDVVGDHVVGVRVGVGDLADKGGAGGHVVPHRLGDDAEVADGQVEGPYGHDVLAGFVDLPVEALHRGDEA